MTRSKRTDATCVGMSAYCSPNVPGFDGRIKAEPEDFEVREIDMMGKVVELTTLAVPTNAVEATPKKTHISMEMDVPDGGWKKYLVQVVGATAYSEIEQVDAGTLPSYTLLSPIDLAEKVALLKSIQDCFPSLQCDTIKAIASETTEAPATIQLSLDPLYLKLKNGSLDIVDCKRVMQFLLKGPMHVDAENGVELSADMNKDQRTKVHRLVASSTACLVTKTNAENGITVYFSPKMLKKRKRKHKTHTYVQFTLRKVNVDHFSALEMLVQTLKTSVSSFTYAGTKDKRAITYQKLVVQDISPSILVSSCDTLAHQNLSVGDLEFVAGPLTLGQSKGNQFTIRVKETNKSNSTIEAAISNLKTNGFINYFGFQRVGHPNSAVRTHHIGQALYQQNWEKAIELVFTPSERDTEVARTIKHNFLTTRDVNSALKALPPAFVLERTILMGLKRFGEEAYEKAIMNIPHHRKVMYYHAFQSYVFNLMASSRVELYGKTAVIGDIYEDPADNTVKVIQTEDQCALVDVNWVVLPLFGNNIKYPTHKVGARYHEVLLEHGISPTQANELKGAYRPLFCKPKNLSFKLSENAIELTFQLPPGSFATMLLRELMKNADFEEIQEEC